MIVHMKLLEWFAKCIQTNRFLAIVTDLQLQPEVHLAEVLLQEEELHLQAQLEARQQLQQQVLLHLEVVKVHHGEIHQEVQLKVQDQANKIKALVLVQTMPEIKEMLSVIMGMKTMMMVLDLNPTIPWNS